MADWNLPVLGFSDRPRITSVEVVWADGTPCGLLGDLEQVQAVMRAKEAEEANKQQLRDQGVTVLADHRRK